MPARQISLNGWDTANVTTYDVVNQSIAAQNSTPAGFEHTLNGAKIQGTWEPWTLNVDGAGTLLKLACKVATGTGTDSDGRTLDLKNVNLSVQVDLVQIPDPVTKVVQFKVNTNNANVDVISFGGLGGYPNLQAAFEDWFQKNIAQFNNVFQAVRLNDAAAVGALQWLKPTRVGYAVSEPDQNATLTNSAFGVLAMTDQAPPSDLSAQFNPALISALPAGSNSVFAISAERFAQKFLLLGAQATMTGSKVGDFRLDGNNTEVTNVNEITWQNIKLDDGSVVSPKVPVGGFHLRVAGNKVTLEFKGLWFDYPKWTGSGREVVSVNFTQSVFLTLQKRSDGKTVLMTTNVDPLAPKVNSPDPNAQELPNVENLSVTVSLQGQDRTTENALLWTSITLSIFTVGCVAFSAGFKIASNALAARAAAAANNVAMNGVGTVNVAPAQVVNGYLMPAAPLIGAGAVYNQIALIPQASITLGKFAIGAGVLAGIAGVADLAAWIAYGVLHNLPAQVADPKSKFEDIPAVEDFLANALAVSTWPKMANWELKSVELAQSLLFYGNLQKQS